MVPSLRAAQKAVDAGVDGLVVEGGEGGGFKSTRPVSTIVLLPQVCGEFDLPVIAAGGMVDGMSMAAAFALGAEGVQMGTRMVSAAESPVHDNYKRLVTEADATDTVVLSAHSSPAYRVMRTRFSEGLEKEESVVMGRTVGIDGIAPALLRGRSRSRFRLRRPGGGSGLGGAACSPDHRRHRARVLRGVGGFGPVPARRGQGGGSAHRLTGSF